MSFFIFSLISIHKPLSKSELEEDKCLKKFNKKINKKKKSDDQRS